MDDFYAARSSTKPPLPWTNFPPPFSLVISRADDMPRRGFFDLAVALGRFPEDPRQHRAAWQAECAAVFGPRADASS